jgi:hypothetical protein
VLTKKERGMKFTLEKTDPVKNYKSALQMGTISSENNLDNFEIIMKYIEDSAKKGNCHVSFEILSKCSVNLLTRLGYVVTPIYSIIASKNYSIFSHYRVTW